MASVAAGAVVRVVAGVVCFASEALSRCRGLAASAISPPGGHSPVHTPPRGLSRAPRQSRHRGWLAALCVLFVTAWLGGCSIIDAEKNNRGGFLDEIADEHWMKADSKKMRALRALALEASLARIAMIAPKSAPDRALLARRIGETTKRADIVRRCAFRDIQIPGQDTMEPCFFFDSVMVDYENALFDLAMIALPLEDARNLITRVSGGIASASINPLQLLQSLLDIGREAFRYGRVVGAIYRDTLELEVQVWLASPGLADRVGGLAAVYEQGNDNIPAWRAAIAALRAQGLEPVPQPRFFGQLYWVISYICGQIVSRDDEAYAQCAQPKLTEKVPLLPIPGGRSLLSGVGVVGGGGPRGAAAEQLKGQLDQEREARRALQQQVDKLKNDLAVVGRDDWAPYRATLCVADEATFGTKTQQAVKLFKAGLAQKAIASVNDRLSQSEKTKLDDAVKRFPACGRGGRAPPRNPFEVGLLMSGSIDDIVGVLRAALDKARPANPGIYTPGANDFDISLAVSALRGVYKMPAPTGMDAGELGDDVWLQARRSSGI